MYYGQCSQLCGRDHAFMPIAIRVVKDNEYSVWLDQAKKKYAAGDASRRNMIAAVAQ
jgi:cytochrome c oxidase subunit II